MTIESVVNLIVSPELQSLLRAVLAMLPAYWWEVPASSSGKYHPAFSLGEGGLVRHSIVVAVFARRIALAQGQSERIQDLMTIAGLIHDGLKQGTGEGAHTVHEHPVLMANFLRENFPGEDGEFLAHVVESHMGQWSTSKYSDVILPTPQDDYQKILSAADMCAATRELGFEF